MEATTQNDAPPVIFPPGASYVIKLTESDGKGKYAWREQLSGPQKWVDGPARGSLELNDWPAYEVNGNGALPLGMIVIARPTNVGDLRFQHGGCN